MAGVGRIEPFGLRRAMAVVGGKRTYASGPIDGLGHKVGASRQPVPCLPDATGTLSQPKLVTQSKQAMAASKD